MSAVVLSITSNELAVRAGLTPRASSREWIHSDAARIDFLPSTRGNAVFVWIKNVGQKPIARIAIGAQGQQAFEKTFRIDEGLLPGQRKRLTFKVPASCLPAKPAKEKGRATDRTESGSLLIWISEVDDRKFPAPVVATADKASPSKDRSPPLTGPWPQLNQLALTNRQTFERLPNANIVAFASGDSATIRIGDEEIPIQLAGVSAPTEKARAKAALTRFQSLALGRSLRIQFVTEQKSPRLAIVYHNGVNLNERLIRLGASRYEPKTYKCEALQQAEAAAQRARVGLWQSARSSPR